MVELVKPSEETNSEPSQFWYINTSSAQVPDNSSAADTIDNLLTVDKAVNNLSGKIETFSLSDAIETSLSMETSLESEMFTNLVARRGSIKRCCRTAALESGSDLSPRTKQSSLHTPGNSDQLDSSNLLRFLNNCNKINDL